MKVSIRSEWFFRNYNAIFIVYGLVAMGASMQSLLLEPNSLVPGGALYPQYNNYLIFKNSFYHLIHQQDLYNIYPAEQGDLYKYSPSFALFFAPFALLPDSIGLVAWNMLNAFCLFMAFRMLPQGSVKSKILMLTFVLVELITSLQNTQSNALMAGMIILAFAMLERDRYFMAALLISGTVFIKIFGLFAFALFLFYPNKVRFITASVLCSIAWALLPLLVIPTHHLQFLYASWLDLLINDHSVSYGLSVMGWLSTWFGLTFNKNLIVGIGLILLGLPFLRWKRFDDYEFRISMLASILIWIVIFNHKAESPTFIIAIAGVAVWYFSQEKNMVNFILLILAFVFTSLSPTDIFPAAIQDRVFDPFVVKAVPCIIIWAKIVWDAIREKKPIMVQSE